MPLVSLFPFITALKQRPGVPVADVDTRVEAERLAGTSLGIVSTTMDAYASTETHSGVAVTSADLVLPVYTSLTPNGPAVRLCTSSELTVPDGTTVPVSFNKLGNRRFLRFSVPAARTLRIRVSCPASDAFCAGLPQPDPDFVLSRAADVTVAEDATSTVEELDIAGDRRRLRARDLRLEPHQSRGDHPPRAHLHDCNHHRLRIRPMISNSPLRAFHRAFAVVCACCTARRLRRG